MENAYPRSNILVVTLTNEGLKRVEAQSEKETLREAIGMLRDIFGPEVPTADRILVPPWWNNRFQRGSYNYPFSPPINILCTLRFQLYLNGKMVVQDGVK
ncbi:hypothetical protein Sjap_010810 [Stephania japonica]|uniref:Amine oxidase domain-containing protein n=1 Tax=Stephania japonica TaxID=461633 RepID=A0AAP0JCA6_9MAGN